MATPSEAVKELAALCKASDSVLEKINDLHSKLYRAGFSDDLIDSRHFIDAIFCSASRAGGRIGKAIPKTQNDVSASKRSCRAGNVGKQFECHDMSSCKR